MFSFIILLQPPRHRTPEPSTSCSTPPGKLTAAKAIVHASAFSCCATAVRIRYARPRNTQVVVIWSIHSLPQTRTCQHHRCSRQALASRRIHILAVVRTSKEESSSLPILAGGQREDGEQQPLRGPLVLVEITAPVPRMRREFFSSSNVLLVGTRGTRAR